MSLLRIDEIFNFEKGILQSSKCVPGEYDFITASSEWKTHNEYTHDCEALIFAAAASGSLGRTHYVNGKFVSSDLCFIITPKDQENLPVDLKFYHILFNELKEEIVRNTKAGTSKEAIGLGSFGKYQLPYFDIDTQIEIKNRIVNAEDLKSDLSNELTHQVDLVKKLRQQLLQDAVMGKLVKQDKGDEPASSLLKKVKEKYLSSNKLKKELPSIKQEEVPFEIPKNWIWCRLNDITDAIVDCPHSTPSYVDYETGYYGIDTNCINEKGEITRLRSLSYNSYQDRIKRLVPKENDIIYAREGSIGLATLIPKGKNICLGQRVLLFRASEAISHSYLIYVVTDIGYKNRLLAKHRGMGAKHINVKDIVESLIALPPYSEQIRIVNKLDELMKFCNELEACIKQSESQNNKLQKQVLREALRNELVKF